MNTWNTLPESYQQRVYNNTRATVKRQIQLMENTTPAMVISIEAARVGNPVLLHLTSSYVVFEEPVIGSTDPNIPIDNNCVEDKLDFGTPLGSCNYEDEGDECVMHDAIPTASQKTTAHD
jgi:hypothetical protein